MGNGASWHARTRACSPPDAGSACPRHRLGGVGWRVTFRELHGPAAGSSRQCSSMWIGVLFARGGVSVASAWVESCPSRPAFLPSRTSTLRGRWLPPRPRCGTDARSRCVSWSSRCTGPTCTRTTRRSRVGGRPVVPGGPRLVRLGGVGTPRVVDLSICELAIARGQHTLTVRALVADGLDLRHRLPELYAAVREGRCDLWVARKVASMTRNLDQQAAAAVDRAVADAVDQGPGQAAGDHRGEGDRGRHRAGPGRAGGRTTPPLRRGHPHRRARAAHRDRPGGARRRGLAGRDPGPGRRRPGRPPRPDPRPARRRHPRRAPLGRAGLAGPPRRRRRAARRPGPAPRPRREDPTTRSCTCTCTKRRSTRERRRGAGRGDRAAAPRRARPAPRPRPDHPGPGHRPGHQRLGQRLRTPRVGQDPHPATHHRRRVPPRPDDQPQDRHGPPRPLRPPRPTRTDRRPQRRPTGTPTSPRQDPPGLPQQTARSGPLPLAQPQRPPTPRRQHRHPRARHRPSTRARTPRSARRRPQADRSRPAQAAPNEPPSSPRRRCRTAAGPGRSGSPRTAPGRPRRS